jgi:transglutaminase superfamily protein
MPYYALAGHVFVCLQGEHVVFLDVRRDRYFALEARKTASLGTVVPGWPVSGLPRSIEPSSDEPGSSILAVLLERGLLSTDERAGKSATPVCVERISTELSADSYPEPTRADIASVARFGASAISASCMLRLRGFARVVERVRRRNQRNAGHHFDADRAHRLVATFALLRPFFFTAKDMCLFEALALSEFLARHELFPRWVFGVQARPFAAHCWLQHGATLVNDTCDHVGRYTPIMVV